MEKKYLDKDSLKRRFRKKRWIKEETEESIFLKMYALYQYKKYICVIILWPLSNEYFGSSLKNWLIGLYIVQCNKNIITLKNIPMSARLVKKAKTMSMDGIRKKRWSQTVPRGKIFLCKIPLEDGSTFLLFLNKNFANSFFTFVRFIFGGV